MSKKDQQLQYLLSQKVVAVVRLEKADSLLQAAQALSAGGVKVIEFTMTTPGALDIVATAARELGPEVLLGAGTVLDPETARSAILAGAQFIVAPTLNPEVITLCHRYNVLVIPGALTPTEILAAWEAGADLVKVFPAAAVGPRYLRDVLAPLPYLRLLPTGGVTLENVGDFLRAGAAAVGIGGNLVDPQLVSAGKFAVLTERARQFVQAVNQAR
ncbi:MAG: bifunctional 4-hydroxy-2-oxoglutarate aldolase/2-dehydro-3-deoxy-phosphogluconate aldolase [Deinococcus sp.]|nr:bifunctional 4-hydroxy-2-oxoglutarate aldolase/2-dehydro-3-deoxy-phosphogluconate aldolase [Deinococcus sp.]